MTSPHRGRWRYVVAVLALCLGFIPLTSTPAPVSAAKPLVGGMAVIANANGDRVYLRKSAGTDGKAIGRLSEGSVLQVLDGPKGGTDGGLWYRVSYNGTRGYMSADFLSAWGGDGSGGDLGVVTSNLNLRSGPSTGDSVLAVMQSGAQVTLTGSEENGFYPVRTSGGTNGWAYGAYIQLGSTVSGTPARANINVNLRSAPSTSGGILDTIPAGRQVRLTGESSGTWVSVSFDGSDGWTASEFLTIGGDRARTNSSVNFRTSPSLDSSVRQVISANRVILVTGSSSNGFYPIDYNGRSGWVSVDFVRFSGSSSSTSSSSANSTSSSSTSSTSSSSSSASSNVSSNWDIIWPISGGTWQISQGYNGSSHYSSGLWAYYYSMDLVNTSGATAGSTVYSPVNGTVRWTEAATGGIAIDMGNGYAYAMFHMTLDPGITDGVTLTQGQAIGHVSGPGENGNMGFDHLHITVWSTSDGGNWDRTAVPFTGQNAIEGSEFYDTGGGNQWYGTYIYP
ncbi:MAG: SH3 domain-containing protein [Thermomicrobiales bacterium]